MLLVPILLAAQLPRLDPLPKDPRLFRPWVTVATNGADYTGYLRLLPDGRFTQRFVERNPRRTRAFSGRYQFGKMNRKAFAKTASAWKFDPNDVPDWPIVSLEIDFDAAVKLGATKKDVAERQARGERNLGAGVLIFDPQGPVLHDMITVVYAPVGQEKRVKRLIERERRP